MEAGGLPFFTGTQQSNTNRHVSKNPCEEQAKSEAGFTVKGWLRDEGGILRANLGCAERVGFKMGGGKGGEEEREEKEEERGEGGRGGKKHQILRPMPKIEPGHSTIFHS